MGTSMHAAQRMGQSSFDLSSLNLNLVPAAPPMVGISTNTREAQLSRRVKEVEEELRIMRIENEKQVSILFHNSSLWLRAFASCRKP
jgi:hypothetical protein